MFSNNESFWKSFKKSEPLASSTKIFWFVQLDTFGENSKTTYLGCINLEKIYFIKNKNANFVLFLEKMM
jgi:hypothetical protein